MAWAILILAGVFEVIWAYSMKMSEGFTHLTPSIITVVFMILSVVLLSISMKTLPLVLLIRFGQALVQLDHF
jgi:quaternary ammonium compound-resistance protein SugE